MCAMIRLASGRSDFADGGATLTASAVATSSPISRNSTGCMVPDPARPPKPVVLVEGNGHQQTLVAALAALASGQSARMVTVHRATRLHSCGLTGQGRRLFQVEAAPKAAFRVESIGAAGVEFVALRVWRWLGGTAAG